MDEAKLLQKIRDLEALVVGGATEGERAAAGNARERIVERLRAMERTEPLVEYRFKLADGWSMRLFLALCRRYDLRPYRHRGQRRTTVMVRVPERFVRQTLWPHFERASTELRRHMDEIAERVIAEAVGGDSGDAEERDSDAPKGALPSSGEDS